ncbi:MAG: MoxR family ATPase [Chitinophagales bacterium]|nr:MoxR family ATPase [Chitinophagales bacterium]
MEAHYYYQGSNAGLYQDELNFLNNSARQVKIEISKMLVGQNEYIDLMLAAILSGGHVLLEGVPGIAKTLSAKLLSKTLSVGFSRIQFTPDLMPTDVVGTTVFNMKSSEFNFKKGPVFSNFILIDEINRSPAKTQAALFEVMEEKQVTVDGITHVMDFPFFVIATQNPIEQEGTYRLPEAQLDRFLFRVKMKYPDLEEEKLILRKFVNDFSNKQINDVQKVLEAKDLKRCQEIVENIYIKEELLDYIAKIVFGTRNNGDLFLGASPRASLAILKASKAMAALSGRNFVIPDDIRMVATPVLNHRIIPSPEKEMEGITAEDIVSNIIKNIEVPR